MTKTTADEALEAFKLYTPFDDEMESYIFTGLHEKTIFEALSLLSAVQGGKCKVLEREPTDELVISAHSRMTDSAIGQAEIDEGKEAYRAFWDAAESYAAPSAAEVGE